MHPAWAKAPSEQVCPRPRDALSQFPTPTPWDDRAREATISGLCALQAPSRRTDPSVRLSMQLEMRPDRRFPSSSRQRCRSHFIS
jgi:hypothetical protein